LSKSITAEEDGIKVAHCNSGSSSELILIFCFLP